MALLMLQFLSLFFLLSSSSSAAAGGTIPLGSTMTPANSVAGAAWTSANNTFSVSFIPAPDNSSAYIAAITYSAGGFPVWSTRGGAAVDSSGYLSVTNSGDLVLSAGNGSVLWRSGTDGRGVAAADLDESGNLKLVSANSTVVWQSFDHPTDTILENQNLSSGQSLKSGSYSFALLSSGNLTLRWNGAILYYNKGIDSSYGNVSLSSPMLTIQSNGIVTLSDSSLSSPAVIAYSTDYGESDLLLRFLRLDSDGNLRAYSVPKGNDASPTVRWSAVSDQCEVYGWCGNMGICTYDDTSSLVCICPSQDFDFVDPNDSTKGCKRKVEIKDCLGNLTMLQLNHTQFLTYPPEISTEQYFVGITACGQNCLSGPSCVASTALADGSGLCDLKVSDFLSGYQSSAMSSTSLLKVCALRVSSVPSSTPGKTGSKSSKLKGWLIGVMVVGIVFGLVALESIMWLCFCRKRPMFGSSSPQSALFEYASGAPVHFSYKKLYRSTKGFKEELGAGGFGVVYKGVLNRTVVAVKLLDGIEQGEKHFRMEVAIISSTHHMNLVTLVGFCSEGRHRLLVYEYMKNGSLAGFLFSAGSSGKLNWAARFKVALGMARGITYLHEQCRDCIVHCDIKPENILLDENYNAKVSDFGLVRLIHHKDHRHRALTSVRGTRGYLAPEWLANLPITAKSDVYSYGMVLLEIVSGRRNFDVSEETRGETFSVWAQEEFEKGNTGSVVDRSLSESELDVEQLNRVLRVSFMCIQEQPSHRPSMGKVLLMLEGKMEIKQPPASVATDESVSSSNSSRVSYLSASVASQQFAPLASLLQATEGSSSEISRRNKSSQSLHLPSHSA